MQLIHKAALLLGVMTAGLSFSMYGQKPVTSPYSMGTPVNYIRTWTPTAPTADASGLPGKGLTEVKEATRYFDGLGRPLQTVVKKGSMVTTDVNNVATDAAGAKDQVTPVLYDAFGREQYQFSPYASTSSDGLLKTDPFSELLGASGAKYGSQGEDNYYSQTVFEASPLNRVMEQFAPGKNWAGTATQSVHRSIKTDYRVNTATDAVRIWTVNHVAPAVPVASDYTASGVYPAGELYKNVTEDEHQKQVVEFKDKAGQVILKKVQLTAAKDGGVGSGHDGWICTYYIYDDLNRLRCVIQPEGVKALAGNGWQLTSNLLSEQCFRYEYDDRSRMVVKKVSGAAEVVMVYDVRDRLVMTQDGNQRGTSSYGYWLYTQYDNLNRPVKTGLLSANNTPATHWNAAMSKTGDTNADIQYPDANSLSFTTPLTQTFYDDYSWVDDPYNNVNISNTAGFKAFDELHNSYLLGASNTIFPYAQAPAK
ncbi:MAG: hypothetical protein J7599_24145, partial [Niabella sp.]|nr:hypothetical protein [Niabella sp.]